MRVLFVSGELIGSAIVHRLIEEGHEVRLYIDHIDRKNCLRGFVRLVEKWQDHLGWVGTDGLVIFDDVIFEDAQRRLRQEGFSVFGGDSRSDQLELNRSLFQQVLDSSGVPVLPSYDFDTVRDARQFVQDNPGIWVAKQSSHIGMLNYVGQREDAQDILDVLQMYQELDISPMHLQRRVHGVEIGVARYFNGHHWVGPIELNIEHKPLFNGDIGPLTAEMGTLMWYEQDEKQPLFQATLNKITDYLRKIEYKGDIDINCIVERDKVWPLEATARFGTPSTEAQCELHYSPWGSFLKAVADGQDYDLDYDRGYGIVVSVAVPPFPFAPEVIGEGVKGMSEGTGVYLSEGIKSSEMSQIHFEEVSCGPCESKGNRYFIGGKHGYALYVTGKGKTVGDAQDNVYGLLKKIHIPRMFYRTDIGDRFKEKDESLLRQWGWI